MSTTDYDEYFINGPASGVGGGGGGAGASADSAIRFSRSGSTTTGTPLRLSGGAQMNPSSRRYVFYAPCTFQRFNWFGNTNDQTNIGVEVTLRRVISGTVTIVQQEILDVPSYAADLPYFGTLSAPFVVQKDDLLTIRIWPSPTGGTAASVNNCGITFERQ